MAKEKTKNNFAEDRAVKASVAEETSINQDALFEQFAHLVTDPSVKKMAKFQMPPPTYDEGEYPEEETPEEDQGRFREAINKYKKSSDNAIQRHNTQNIENSNKYSQITRHLERFAFSEGEEKEAQLLEIETCLRNKLNEMIIKKVAQNTKTAFVKYANKFSLIPGGIKVGFTFGDKNLFVVAKGNFYGDEIIAIDADNNTVKPQVIKVQNNKKYDLSEQFEINIIK